jgi:spermidine/putrescine transport system ATP-binding protein
MAHSTDLDIVNVIKRFGSHAAVNDVSFSVAPGEFFSILGPSGCGKTTLMRMIAGFEHPTSGDIRIRGQSMIGVPANKRPVNMVFQSLALFPMMSVGENVAYGLTCRGVSRADAEERAGRMLERVGLKGFGDRRVTALSGGQRQRVAIARALALAPDIIVADEPTSALDVSVRAQVLNLLSDLKTELNLGMVFISHDIQTVRYVSDRICVMYFGEIVEEGPAAQVFDHPRNDYTRKLLGAAPSLLHT